MTRKRSGWPARRTLAALGISPRTYYRWRKQRAWDRDVAERRLIPGTLWQVSQEEQRAVKDYALKHPELRHRELAWRMVDEDVAFVSPSSVYRILKGQDLVCPWRRRSKRYREAFEQASRPDERWSTDLMHLPIGDRVYYLVSFMDEYSRYIVHWELLAGMDGLSVSLAAAKAIEVLRADKRDANPEIRSDNGSGYVSREFREVLKENGLNHRRIWPHCPEENGLMERAYRTLREQLDGTELTDCEQARQVLGGVIEHYNQCRLHSALGYLRPADYYRGNPEKLKDERRRKLAAARHTRRERNLGLTQGTLPFVAKEIVACDRDGLCH